MPEEVVGVDISVMTEVLTALNKLDPDARKRLIQSVQMLYGIEASSQKASRTPEAYPVSSDRRDDRISFSEDRSLSPKEFVWQKQPKNGIERVACLAYYLVHFRDLPHFKTSDISALNTEAAQVKFSNAAMTVSEATRAGYLATVNGQEKQMTVVGEQFVIHLPDRERAMAAVKHAKPKRSRRKVSAVKGFEVQP